MSAVGAAAPKGALLHQQHCTRCISARGAKCTSCTIALIQKGGFMVDRNQSLIEEIVYVLNDSVAERILLDHFKHRLILDVGSVDVVTEFAKDLRLNITKEECSQVLDHIAAKAMVGISIENVDEAINTLFNNRFIEPEQQ